MLFNITLDTIDFPYLHLWIQPTQDSTNHESKIFIKKKFREVPKSKTWICHASNYLHNIYIVLAVISNLEMI